MACSHLAGLVLLVACTPAAPDVADAPDARPETWATYTIAAGDHDAHLTDRTPRNPIDGVVSVVGRDYALILDDSAMYEIVAPVEPDDQLDWNKLPGLSDCGTVDLAVDGAMFGWRWRPELAVLEITAYANTASVHRWLPAPLLILDPDDLAARAPLRYRVARGADSYTFAIAGELRGRVVDVSASLPRRCSETERDPLAWASGLYFGGTSTAPHAITARILEASYTELGGF